MDKIAHNSHNISAFGVEDSKVSNLKSEVCQRLYHAWNDSF